MAVYQPCLDIAQLTMYLVADGQSIIHNLYFFKGDHWSAASIQTLANDATSSWLSDLAPVYTDETAFYGTVATDLTSLTSPRHVDKLATPVVGTHAGTNAPQNACLALQLGTGDRGRGHQGRIFHGPLVAGSVIQDTVDATYANAIVSGWEAFVAHCLAGLNPAKQVVLSRYLNGQKRPFGISMDVINIGYSNLAVDSQRDRLPGHKKRKIKVVP